MPSDERSTRSAERCDQHPTRSSVARCEGCGRALCLPCAVPVRGRVLGVECLPEPLGRPGGEPVRRARPLPTTNALVGAAFTIALLGTAMPWSRFGLGSGLFGAWGRSPRWALLATVAALLGGALWVVRRLLWLGVDGRVDLALAALGGLVALGAALAIWHPPPFTRPWLGPWVALIGGIVASVGAIGGRRRPEERARAI